MKWLSSREHRDSHRPSAHGQLYGTTKSTTRLAVIMSPVIVTTCSTNFSVMSMAILVRFTLNVGQVLFPIR